MSHIEFRRIECGYTQIWRINNGSYSNKLESISQYSSTPTCWSFNPNIIFLIKESVNIRLISEYPRSILLKNRHYILSSTYDYNQP